MHKGKVVWPVLAIAAMLLPQPCVMRAQTAAVDAYTPAQLKQMSAELRTQASASPGGAASEVLKRYPQHYTMLAYRNQSGIAEVHENFADVFIIVEGSATLESGGTVVAPKAGGPGETRGAALKGSSGTPLHAGDIVHIPAGVPHLMKLDRGSSVLYFVIKSQETPAT